jgi:MFS family permease
MIIGIVMGVIPILVYGWVENVTIVLISGILRGAGWGMFSLCSVRYIDLQASVENASTLQSSLIMLSTLANIISSTVSGYLYDTNPNLIFLSSTIIALISLGIIVIVRQMDRQENKEILSEVVPST